MTMTTTPTIAWLANSMTDVSDFMDTMEERGFATAYECHAGPAIDDFTGGRKYSLIVIDPVIAPGPDCTDPEIKRIIEDRPEGPALYYWKVGVRVIELTRRNDSVNRATPIVVMGREHSERSLLFQGARDLYLRKIEISSVEEH